MEEPATTNLYLHSGAIFNVHIKKAAILHSTLNYHFPQAHQDANMSSRQAVFGFIVAALVNFVQIKFQGKSESPFETRPLMMLIAVMSLLVYCLSYDAKLRLSAGDHQAATSLITRVIPVSMVIFGPLSLAAMSSVLFPLFPCSFLFSATIFYSFCQLPVRDLIRRIWALLQIAIKNRVCGQQHQQGSRRIIAAGGRVSVGLAGLSLSKHAFIDQVEIGIRPPV